MIIIGINAYHGDSSACLLRNGEIIAAAEEERFRRIKHWAGFPSRAIAYCLEEAGAALDDVEIVAISSNPRASLLKKIEYTISMRPDYRLIVDRLRNQRKRQSVENELETAFPSASFRGRVVRIEHHLAHIASAFLVGPFREAAVASIDGFGDFASAAWGVGCANRIKIERRVHFPHSLGVFYQALTQYLGFPNYGDEYKVMGLAPYGQPRYLNAMRKIVKLIDGGRFELQLQYFRHHQEKIDYAWDGGRPHVGMVFSPSLEELLGPARSKEESLEQWHCDVASSIQAMYEEAFFHILDHLSKSTGLSSLALAGGCAMNSVANGKVAHRSRFRRLYVQSAAGDAGGAIGAAMVVWHSRNAEETKSSFDYRPSVLAGDGDLSRPVMDHAYLGPQATDSEVDALLMRRAMDIKASGCQVEKLEESAIIERAAKIVSAGLIMGWFQGRMEWGPRALGNRSILGDPRRPDMKDILNLKIKLRESFRPFAPSILEEYVTDWFEDDGDVPFMMQVYQIRKEKRALIPAVAHVDGSGRLQTVYKETNGRYWNLINAFRRITGVPMLLNTSFNENEPVVCSPAEALDCFLRTKMDALVLGNHIIQREQAKGTQSADRSATLPSKSDVVVV